MLVLVPFDCSRPRNGEREIEREQLPISQNLNHIYKKPKRSKQLCTYKILYLFLWKHTKIAQKNKKPEINTTTSQKNKTKETKRNEAKHLHKRTDFLSIPSCSKIDTMKMVSSSSSFSTILVTALAATVTFAGTNPVNAQQQIGVDICACSPKTYEFTFDFSLSCPPVNVVKGDAVVATTCLVSPFGDPDVKDLVPILVQTIDILELNQNLQITVQENIGGNFRDGDTFRYTSLAAHDDEIVDPKDIPRAIQLNMIGVNQFDEPIINVYLITFSNNCEAYPVLSEGEYIGWTHFVSKYDSIDRPLFDSTFFARPSMKFLTIFISIS